MGPGSSLHTGLQDWALSNNTLQASLCVGLLPMPATVQEHALHYKHDRRDEDEEEKKHRS